MADPHSRAVRRLLEELIERPPAEWDQALAESEAPPEVRQEAAELLHLEGELDGFLTTPAAESLGWTGPDDAPSTGDFWPEVPGYELTSLLGVGGMGKVYLGRQEEPIERRVAVKVVQSGPTGSEIARRFNQERRALARLNHPNIAQMYEAGTTRDGRPYFAMEYVDGAPITAYCDQRRLSIEKRLRLFLAVCRGVEHAHRKQILHRDLKPSNLLVADPEPGPVPKIIDFGVARALDAPLSEETRRMILGTPEFMSPEALWPGDLGPDLDTRTDVYSLGVILYELLTGTRPFGGDDERLPSLIQKITLQDPPRASQKVEQAPADRRAEWAAARGLGPTQFVTRLRGDLDWILDKALARDRDRRYGSVSDLAADLRRTLAHRPIDARPPTLGDRLVKLIRRNRLAAALGIASILFLITATVVSSIALGRALRAEQEARLEEESARQTLDFLVQLFDASSPEQARGEELTARQVLDRGLERVEEAGDLQPLLRARILFALADVHGRLGLYDEATHLAREALTLREAELRPADGEILASLELLANLERRAGRYDEAGALLERLLDLRRSIGDDDPEARANALNSLANLRWRQGRHDEAEALHLEGLELRKAVLGPDAMEVGASHNNLGALYLTQGRYEEAAEHLAEARRLMEAALGPDHPNVTANRTNLGIVLMRLGRLEESEATLREVLEVKRRVLGSDHLATASAMLNLATPMGRAGRIEEAEALVRECLEVRREVLGESHDETLRARGNLGLIAWRAGRLSEAEVLLREVLEARLAEPETSERTITRSRVNLATVLRDLGRLDEAEELFAQALAYQSANLPPDHRDLVLARIHAGALATRQGHLEKAAERLEAARDSLERGTTVSPDLEVDLLLDLALLRRAQDRPAEAESLLERARALRAERLPDAAYLARRIDAARAGSARSG